MSISRRDAIRMLGSVALGTLVAACSGESTKRRAAPPATTSSTTTIAPARHVVRKLDHVFAVFDDAPRALAFMHDTLQLPLAWPFSDYGTFASGGINLGNLNLEFVAARGPFVAHRPARVTGISFQPARSVDKTLVAELDRRTIAHSPPQPGAAWTNIAFEGLMPNDFNVFATDYQFREMKDDALRRKPLTDVKGGRLGVVRAKELTIGVLDVEAAQRHWESLLAPATPDASMRWPIGSGPALRLVRANAEEVQDLILEVGSSKSGSLLETLRGRNDPLAGLPLHCAAT